MRRPDSNTSPLHLKRNEWVSTRSAAGAGTCHSGASAAEADLIVPPHVAAKAATHKHSRLSPNILLIGMGVGVAQVSRYTTFHSTTKAGWTGMLSARRSDLDVTGERVPIFAERGFCLAENTPDHVVGQARHVVVKPDVTGEQVPIFAERGFWLGAKRSRLRCRSGAMRRSQNGGDFFSRHSGISEGRKCWRTRPASESAPA